ncbi:MAG: GTPase HflX [Eubacteriales bacterium]|nr:GTPase HflX [Eubacteriales bacterium]
MARKSTTVFLQTEKIEVEKAICFGLGVGRDQTEEVLSRSLDELAELARSCGAEVLGTMAQRRNRIDPSTYLGQGKVEELKDLAEALGANLLICDDELSPAQLRNLEDICKMKVIDRSLLILDIFARRAKSSEGKLQVELAQQAYLLPRLQASVGFHSRTGGGIGTRGPGETIMDRDRRHIRQRMTHLRKELKKLAERRNRERQQRRDRSQVFSVAVVGYTNAGKSSLVNVLTQAKLYTEDQVFATLDPAIRSLHLPEVQQDVVLTDTVGFIRKLPHHLVEAFKSTLEEASHAQLILHVIDASDPQAFDCYQVCESLLNELDAEKIPKIVVLNKMDLTEPESLDPELLASLHSHRADEVIYTSVVEKQGLDALRARIAERLIELGATPSESDEANLCAY